MKKKKPPEWLRWLYLVMVIFIPFAAWMDFRNYPHYYELGLFSEERWTEIMSGFHFQWTVQGFMAVCFLSQFIILTWNKNGDKDAALADRIAGTALVLFWAILPLLISIPGSAWGLWAIVLIVSVVVVGRMWVKYFENKRLEEETYE
jgi:Na+/proline symporter